MKKFKTIFLFSFFIMLTSNLYAKDSLDIIDLNWSLENVKPVIGKSITINTKDTDTCLEIKNSFKGKVEADKLEALCAKDSERPYSTLIILHESPFGVTEYGPQPTPLNPDTIKHANNLIPLTILGVGVLLRFSKLKKDQLFQLKEDETIVSSWHENIKAGPQFDNDDFRTNFIEHPISGATYYLVARHSGFSPMESFGFSAFASTFMWELGLEAIFERPSINDTLVTPILGSLLGELMYSIDNHIQNNGNKVFGSTTLGTIVRFITSPGYYVVDGMQRLLGTHDFFKGGDMGWRVVRRQQYHNPNQQGLATDLGPALMYNIRLFF